MMGLACKLGTRHSIRSHSISSVKLQAFVAKVAGTTTDNVESVVEVNLARPVQDFSPATSFRKITATPPEMSFRLDRGKPPSPSGLIQTPSYWDKRPHLRQYRSRVFDHAALSHPRHRAPLCRFVRSRRVTKGFRGPVDQAIDF